MTAAVRTRPTSGRTVRDVHLPGDRPRPATEPPTAARAAPRRASRRTGTGHPDQLTVCACQWGATAHCLHGDHGRCQAQQVTAPEAYLTHADGTVVLDPTPVEVWLADRVCRWVCSCTCHTEQPVQTALF